MRIVSLLPAATEIVLALGLEGELVGVTHRCELTPGAAGPAILTRPGPAERGDKLDRSGLRASDADLVLVGRGDDGAIGGRKVEAVLATAESQPSVLTIAPASVEGVFNAIIAVGAMTEAEDEALGVVEGLRERLQALEEVVMGRLDHGFPPPRVVVLEAVDPPLAAGRWIPDQVRLAGGWELLGRAGERPEPTTWEAVREVDPEVLVLVPDARSLPAGLATWDSLPRPAVWRELLAVRDGRVYVVDGGPFSGPGPRIIDGIEILAELIDPAAFDGMAPPDSWAPAR